MRRYALVPGTFKINPSTRDGRYLYRIDGAADKARGASPSVRAGLAFCG